jgi:D-3-phosphoglycerate dehydrogenase
VKSRHSDKLGKVVVSDVIVGPAIERHWQQLYRQTDLVILDQVSAVSLLEALKDADVLIMRPILSVPRGAIEVAERLRGIVMWGVGYNNVDMAAATEHGLPVVTVPVFLNSIAEAVFCFLMQLTKKYDRLNALIRSGQQPTINDRGRTLEGKTLGSIGLGRIGRRVARLALAFDMNVLVYDPYLSTAEVDGHALPLVPLPELLQQSHFVSLHAPLTEETRHLINAGSLAQMRSDSYLINVARGGLVDEAALYDALVERQIAGAAVDTFETEPVPPDNRLLGLENVWATPHYLGATWEGLAQVAQATQDAALRLLKGETPGYHVVNPEVLGE